MGHGYLGKAIMYVPGTSGSALFCIWRAESWSVLYVGVFLFTKTYHVEVGLVFFKILFLSQSSRDAAWCLSAI